MIDKDAIHDDESMDTFVTRMRKKAARCSFTDVNMEIKFQVVYGCRSAKIRRMALQKDTLTLGGG